MSSEVPSERRGLPDLRFQLPVHLEYPSAEADLPGRHSLVDPDLLRPEIHLSLERANGEEGRGVVGEAVGLQGVEGEKEGVANQEAELGKYDLRILVLIGLLAEVDQDPEVGAEVGLLDRSVGFQEQMAAQTVARAEPGEPGGDLVGVLDEDIASPQLPARAPARLPGETPGGSLASGR